jgi:hypothetical protein
MTDDQINELFKKVNQIHQGLYGVAGTEEKGMLGDFKELCKAGENRETRLTVVEGKVTNLENAVIPPVQPSGAKLLLARSAPGAIAATIVSVIIGLIEYFKKI